MYKLLPLSDEGYTPLQRLLDQLNSRDVTVQADALRAARALSPEDLLRLILLSEDVQRTRGAYCFLLHVIVTSLVFACVFSIGLRNPFREIFLSFVSYIFANVCVSTFYDTYRQAQRQIGVVLLEVEDTRFIPHLLRSTGYASGEGVSELLKRLLPQVRADHAPLWSKADKTTLLLPFKDAAAKDPQLAIACLKALEQIGDKSAVPAVKKLQAQAFAGNRQTLWNAASQCLLYLESNSGKFQQAETLLRSSDIAQVRPDILLRPAAADADNSAGEQLLRPGISNDAP